ncbi:integrase core domain-containing protein [Salibacterium qingdaonense]|uniref:Integrase core domain-containing protein n=1 Tax=Salibacterium qingdaonense TaxID=266892 RepID=A0A1I4KZK9_9BACI|nr:integrase core domain-containing protein [Salibacterium qingdaonense]SFL84023.1 Integrase core domain-containing protein [Salibacterium qingdaonense]
MRSHSTEAFFATLGIQQYFSWSLTPNDNPQIEALFSTVENVPDYPGRFESFEEADHHFQRFFAWYNQEHYHTGLNMVQSVRVHAGERETVLDERYRVHEQTMAGHRARNVLSES